MADKNLNGIATNVENLKHNVVHDDKLYQQFNGVRSSQSSRSSSPGLRLGQIPSSQLPPSRSIPQSQLPPSASLVGNLSQQVAVLNVNQGVFKKVGTSVPQPTTSIGQNTSSVSNSKKDPIQTNNIEPTSVQPILNNTTSLFQQAPDTEKVQKQQGFPPGLFSAQTKDGIQKQDVVTDSPAQVNTNILPAPNMNSQYNPLDTTPSDQVSPISRTQPNQIQNTIGISSNSNETRISPIPPQQNFQISPNRTDVSQVTLQGIQNSQGTLNRTLQGPSTLQSQPIKPIGPNKNFSVPNLQQHSSQSFQPVISQSNHSGSPFHPITPLPSQSGLPTQSSTPLPSQLGNPLATNQQRMYQSFPLQQQDNQRFNPIKNINIGGNMNTNLTPNASPVGPLSLHPQAVSFQSSNTSPAGPPSLNPQQSAPFQPPRASPVGPPSLNHPHNASFQPPRASPVGPASLNHPHNASFQPPRASPVGPASLNHPQSAPFQPPSTPPAGPPSLSHPQTAPFQPPSTSPAGPPSLPRPQPAPFQPPSITQKTNLHSNRYPTLPVNNYQQPSPNQYQYQQQIQKPMNPQQKPNTYLNQNQQQQMPNQGVLNTGFNKHWGMEHIDLLQAPNILPLQKIEPPQIHLGQELLDQANCSPDVFRCTMTKIPENNSLLQKSRLPLGVLIHPFRDLNHLPVIQCNVIVRCRSCRTYINPYVIFVDNKRWKCNLCYRINELPEEFQYDPITKTYGDPTRRPEIKASTLEYIAPAEYMLRPPQPAVYLYLLDVSKLAVESGYLNIVTNILLDELKNLPGDARTQIGFIAYDSALHFYSLPEGITQPHEMTILDIDDVFLPTPDNLLVNLKDRMDLIADLLRLLPVRFANTFDTNSALGAALQVAFKMMGPTGGRVTVFQAALPNIGPGALTPREDPAKRTSAEVAHLNPANDFYKRLALECSGQQIAVDMFIVNSQYVDVATISGISRFSGGCLHHFPLLKPTRPIVCDSFARSFKRYITRKIGFEAVMRIRCTRGLSIHTFHGNFFVRSTDLLSLPNINPDAGFGMQVAIEESLADVQTVCFQAALLYTSSKGERRIRVHTMCLPVASTLQEIIHSADQQCIIGLLSKMAVDRSMQSNLSDAREAFINVAIDILSSYKISLNLGSPVMGLLVPDCLRLLPLYISALLKHAAFRTNTSTRLDDRVMKMIDMKTKPLYMLIKDIYPDLFPIHNLEQQEVIMNSEEEPVSMPPRLQLTARSLENKGAFLLDMGESMIIFICPNVSQEFLTEALGVSHYNAVPDDLFEIPILDNIRNERLRQFVQHINEEKPFVPPIQVIRDNSNNRGVFFERLIEDRVETALSYHEFLQHLKTQVK